MLGVILLLQTLTVAVSGPPTSLEYLPLRVAAAEGHFTREGLAVTLRTTRAEVGAAEALAQGQVDLAATSLEAVLRFGYRAPAQAPRLVFALTAAPPVALLASKNLEGIIRSVDNLIGLKVGVATPGAPEHAWLNTLLDRAGLRLTQVELVSLGTRGLVAAVESGDVQAGLVGEPHATRLISEGLATLVADLRDPAAVAKALGGGTVNAAVFARADRRPRDLDLAGLARALLAAEATIVAGPAEALAARLPKGVVGTPEEFEQRLAATRRTYLPEGVADAQQVRATIALIRAWVPLSPALKLPSPEELLHLAPVRRANRPR